MKHSNLATKFAKLIRKHGAVSAERLSKLTRCPLSLVESIMAHEMPKHMQCAGLWTWR